MHRIYFPHESFPAKVIITDIHELHHLKNVLRLKKNDRVSLFNGKDLEALGTIGEISAHQASVSIDEVKTLILSTPYITLACAMPKKGKFETIVEKTTELGVDEIITLKTTRSEVVLKGDRLSKKQARFETVAMNAAKQSQRIRLPYLYGVLDFKAAVDLLTETQHVLLASLAPTRTSLSATLQRFTKDDRFAIMIGPEGDFTDEEHVYAVSRGAIPVSLGANVLKVETAAIAAVSFVRLFYSS